MKLSSAMTSKELFSLSGQNINSDTASSNHVCPLCSREFLEEFVSLKAIPESMRQLILANTPNTNNFEEVCSRCFQIFARAENQISKDAAVKKDGSHILSIPLRMNAVEHFTGKNITIAFLDSGFYPHEDLIKPRNRIFGYQNMVTKSGGFSQLFKPDVASWHGMMTSVVAAGNGSLSKGFYRGIAPDANLVLVKLAKTGRITEQNIQDGLEWVLENRAKFSIKIVNISAGGDFEQSYLHNSLSQTVEACVSQGLMVVCAVGNAGHLPNHPVLPPASSPSCIAVGGLDDKNSINRSKHGMYRSSYGPTIDGFQKPEIIAPSIWVPAPILPGTPTAQQVELLKNLDKAKDVDLHKTIIENSGIDAELDAAIDCPAHSIRQIIALKLRQELVITKHYKYVDGTSFAAPIVSSVAAQMLEANPNLTAQQVKRILIRTAERLPHYEVDRQGWGVVNPRKAVEMTVSFSEG